MDKSTINPSNGNSNPFLTGSPVSDTGHGPKKECPSNEKNKYEKKTPKVFDEAEYEKRCEQCHHDIEHATDKALRLDYPDEYKARANAKSRALHEYQCPYSAEFDNFRFFLNEVGPKPCQGTSLDKIVNEKGYVPGNVRWADPQTQSENRRSVRKVVLDGHEHSVDTLASRLGLSREAVLKRLSRGATMEQLVHQSYAPQGASKHPTNGISAWPWPPGMEEKWEQRYQQCKRDVYGDRDEPRIHYFLRRCAEQLQRITEMAEGYDPDDELPPELIHFGKYWSRMQDFALHQRQLAEKEQHRHESPQASSEEIEAVKSFLGL